MTIKTRVVTLGLLLSMLAACTSVDEPTPTATNSFVMTGGGGAEVTTPDAAIETVDQAVADGTVTVPRVVSSGPGWLVIYNDEGGQPGSVIGHRMLLSGESTDRTVEIDTEAVTDTLYAVIHVDLPEVRTFDYPDGDPRLTDEEGNLLAAPFMVTVP